MCRFTGVNVYLSATTAIGSGYQCASNLTAPGAGALMSASCPSNVTGARYLVLQRPGTAVTLIVAEVQLFRSSEYSC